MKYLFVLNDPPYGTERSYNAIRFARELLKNSEAGNEVRVFLIGDACDLLEFTTARVAGACCVAAGV